MSLYRPQTYHYVYSTGNLPGQVSGYNFLSLVNPSGSGKTLFLSGIFISNAAVAASTATSSMRGLRVSNVSGGTVESANIAKFVTTDPDPVGEVRISGVTMTLGNQLFNSPPAVTTTAVGGDFVHQIPVPAPFALLPGEGFGMRTNSGDTDQRWNLSVVWREVTQ